MGPSKKVYIVHAYSDHLVHIEKIIESNPDLIILWCDVEYDAETNIFGNLLEQTNPEIIVGYHAWARPLANFLRHHAIFIPLFAYITQAWAYEMCEQLGVTKNRSTFSRLLGKIVMNVGKPVCGFIGKTILSMQGKYEYHRT